MKTDIRTLVRFDMHRNLRPRLQWSAGGRLKPLYVGGNDVVGLANRHSLGELAGVIGIELPARLFLVVAGQADLHFHSVDGMAVRIPDRSIDQGVRLRLLGMARSRARRG